MAGGNTAAKAAAAGHARDNIRCNAIAPGWHQGTNLGSRWRASASPEETKAFDNATLGQIPMGRRGRPEELSGLIVLLASDASSLITGQVFVQDGGWCAA
jgi:NAD(P)-dependent dehydrogenase (short-subunit alcohol dehydrogenase family)